MANFNQMVRDSTIVTIERAYRKPQSLFRMLPTLILYNLAFPQNGVPNAPTRTNFTTSAATNGANMIEDID